MSDHQIRLPRGTAEATPQQHPYDGGTPLTGGEHEGAARYAVGPSAAGLHGGVSAPGVAEAVGRQGTPDGHDAPGRVVRAADAAALHRVARRRSREEVQRTQRVDVRYSVEEKARILQRARSLNIAGAHLVGAAVMAYLDGELALPGQRTEVDDRIDELAALRTQVAKIGANVNQIAHRLNAAGDAHPVDTAVLDRAQTTLHTAREAVAALDQASDLATSRRKADR